VDVFVRNSITNKKTLISARYILAADGFHSIIREKLGVKMSGFSSKKAILSLNIIKIYIELQSFINIFFKSPTLASEIKKHREFAMLHFIYNSEVFFFNFSLFSLNSLLNYSKICAVLVNHSIEKGLFVLQIPIFPPFDDYQILKSKAKSLILACLDKSSNFQEKDFEVINVGMWNLAGLVAETYYKNRCFLIGDSAHSFPPAGFLHNSSFRFYIRKRRLWIKHWNTRSS